MTGIMLERKMVTSSVSAKSKFSSSMSFFSVKNIL